MQQAIPPASPRCTLLSLPAEVRVMIWDYTFGGNLVVLYRGRRHLTHTRLGDNNSQVTTQDVAITPETIDRALKQLPGTTRVNPKRITSSNKLKGLAQLPANTLSHQGSSTIRKIPTESFRYEASVSASRP